jgi:uncharacterized BrkB/YihY/UPF0761 family membrane protein
MIIAFTIVAILLVPSAFIFWRGQPRTKRVRELRHFNKTVVVLVIATAIVTTLYSWLTTGQSSDRAWWPIMAILGSCFFIAMELILSSAVRYFMFRGDEKVAN